MFARPFRTAAALAAACLAVPLLTGCGGGGSGPVVLQYYGPNDHSGAYQAIPQSCARRSHGRYRVHYNTLPTGADGQRLQLVRRLAARDRSMDLMGLDITWEAEFAAAGWIVPWSGRDAAVVRRETLPAPLDTATWKGRLYAAPLVTNVQLLWYRKDLVPRAPTTWAGLIAAARTLAAAGKPHYVEVQGAQYEGLTVWFNTLVHSAGGSVLTPNSAAPSLGAPARTALTTMHDLATSPAGDPSLSNAMEDQGRLAMEGGTAAFEVNWPNVWASMQADKPAFYRSFRWAPYPRVDPDRPAQVTTGGLDLAVSTYSRHRDLAFALATCMRGRTGETIAAERGNYSPVNAHFYEHPDATFVRLFPFYQVVYAQLRHGTNRPKTPAYQSVSIVISHAASAARGLRPGPTERTMRQQISDALQSKGLVP